MTKLSDKSLVKRFAKNAAVTVELGGKLTGCRLIYQKQCCTDNKKSPEYHRAFFAENLKVKSLKMKNTLKGFFELTEGKTFVRTKNDGGLAER